MDENFGLKNNDVVAFEGKENGLSRIVRMTRIKQIYGHCFF
jgi:hypothetical protein